MLVKGAECKRGNNSIRGKWVLGKLVVQNPPVLYIFFETLGCAVVWGVENYASHTFKDRSTSVGTNAILLLSGHCTKRETLTDKIMTGDRLPIHKGIQWLFSSWTCHTGLSVYYLQRPFLK